MLNDTETHQQLMRLALEEAERSRGCTSPNPMVGAAVVRTGKVLALGYHKKAGTAHAEPDALDKLSQEQTRGADLYVTLEPCCTHGRTPACTQRIITAGIKRVFYGCQDPNPEHAGQGFELLRQAGIEVHGPILEQQCLDLNQHFFKWISTKKPFVILKMASTLDGRIATASGHSQWITGAESREFVQQLRRDCDAIMVGGETLIQDNPSLTVRDDNWPRQPQRYIWSSRDFDKTKHKAFNTQDAAAAQVTKPQTSAQWQKFLIELGQRDYTCLLLEGGGELAASALQADIVDQACFFIAPKILGGRNSRCSVGGEDPESLAQAIELENPQMRQFGRDFLISGRPKKSLPLK